MRTDVIISLSRILTIDSYFSLENRFYFKFDETTNRVVLGIHLSLMKE